MKLNFIRIIVLLAGITLFYAACKKTASKPAAKLNVDYKALSSKIAVNLYRSLVGAYGGTSINNGVSLPKTVSNHKGPVINSLNASCGFTVDSVFNFQSMNGDTTQTFSGGFTFTLTCSTTTVDGYTVHAIDTNKQGNINFTSWAVLTQNYVVKALDQTYKLVSLDGSLTDTISAARFTGPFTSPFGDIINSNSITTSDKYVLTGLVVDATSGVADVTKGTATFLDSNVETDVNNPGGKAFGDQGTIVFLGNHTVQVTFNQGNGVTVVYMVNLLTGVATLV
jgi:hypothetical protein